MKPIEDVMFGGFDDFLMYEICFPGAITGQTEVTCPYCKTLLTVSVADPMGVDRFACGECTGEFEVDFGEGIIRYDRPADNS